MYSANLQAYSPAYTGKMELELTGKVLLPPSALNTIYSNENALPSIVLFCISNFKTGMKVYAGVDSFTAQEGQIIMPYWMMEAIQINEGTNVRVNTTNVRKGTSATFQPTDSSFLDLKDTKVVLEHALRQHPCLTQGSIIPIDFARKRYFIKILKTEPSAGIFTLKADLAVEFAPPETDFKHRWLEPDTDSSDDEGDTEEHTGYTLRGKEVKVKEEKKIKHSTFEMREKERLKPGAVSGVRKFEMGQEILPPKPVESSMIAKEKKKVEESKKYQGIAHSIKRSKSKGSSSNDLLSEAAKPVPKPEPQPEQPVATKNTFTGKGRTIRGKVTEIPKEPEPPKPKAEEEENKLKKEQEFIGKGKSVRGKVITIEKEEEPEPDPNLLYGKKKVKKEDEDPFKGIPHSLK